MAVQIKSQTGDVVGEIELDQALFGTQVNVPLMHQVVRAQMAAARAGTHDTKTRAEVSGGGKKPWRQKGTGRARQGSTRAPHWKGGGVVMGPHPRDHSFKVPKKMKLNALRSALSDRAREGNVTIVDRFAFEGPKTSDAAAALKALGVAGKVLIVLESPDMTVGKSFRNIDTVHLLTVDQLNTYDVLASDAVVFTRAALDKLVARSNGDKPDPKGGDEAETRPDANGGDEREVAPEPEREAGEQTPEGGPA